MKFFYCLSAAALVCSTVLAADRDHSKDENSSNNSKISLLDFEITDEKPVQEGVLALMINSCDLDFSLAYDTSILTSHLPLEVLFKIIFATQHEYRRLAETCKLFYRATRPIHYQCMKTLVLKHSDLACTRFRDRFGPTEEFRTIKVEIATYMAFLADNDIDAWVKDILNGNLYDLATVVSLLRGEGTFTGIVGPKLLSSLCSGVVDNCTLFYSLAVESSLKNGEMFTVDDLILLLYNTPKSATGKYTVLRDLLLKRDDLLEVKKIIADSIDPSLWNFISSSWFENAPIDEITRCYNSLPDKSEFKATFENIGFLVMPFELICANSFASRLGKDHLKINTPSIYSEHIEFHLLDESFCNRHDFSEEDCLGLFLFTETRYLELRDTLISKFNPSNEWAKKLMYRFAQNIPIEYRPKSFTYFVLTGEPVRKFTAFSELIPLNVAKLAAGLDPLSKLLSAEEIKYVVEKSSENLVPLIGDRVAIALWLPSSQQVVEFCHRLTQSEFKMVVEAAIAQNRSELFSCFSEVGHDKTLFDVLIEHVNQNPDFDSTKFETNIHTLLVLASSNEAFRSKHLEGVRRQGVESLKLTVGFFPYSLSKEQLKQVWELIDSFEKIKQ